MKILHAYCLNYNLGDYALGYGVKKALREMLPVDFIAEVNLQGQVFDEYFIDIVNSKYDLLVIGGGGIIHGAHWPQGWFWLIESALISRLKIPFIVFAAGYNYFKDEAGIPERGILHLAETAKRARLFSVRNDGSYDRLKSQTGIDAKVIADPGFWVGRNESFERPVGVNGDYIVIQLANDKPEHRFGDASKRQRFVEQMRAIVTELSRRYAVILCPHVHEDISLSQKVAEGIENAFLWPFSEFAFDKVAKTFGYYEHASCVLAMRGHGQIVPMSFGVPTVSLENHHKHRGLMESMGVGEFNVEVGDEKLVDKTVSLVCKGIEQRVEIRKHLQTTLNSLWSETSHVFKMALSA